MKRLILSPSKAIAKGAERSTRKSPAASGAKFWAFSSHAEGYFRRKAILATRKSFRAAFACTASD